MSNKFTICIIDDDDVYQYSAERTIREEDIAQSVMVFSEAENALQYLAENSAMPEKLPEVILLDIFMPVMDGWEFLDEYVKLKPKINKKILLYVVTSSVSASDKKRAERYEGISDYIIKPVSQITFREIAKDVQKHFIN